MLVLFPLLFYILRLLTIYTHCITFSWILFLHLCTLCIFCVSAKCITTSLSKQSTFNCWFNSCPISVFMFSVFFFFTCAPRSLTSSTDQRPSYWIQTKIPPSVSQVASFWKGSFHRTKTTLKTQKKKWKGREGIKTMIRDCPASFWQPLSVTLTVFSSEISVFREICKWNHYHHCVVCSMAVKESSSGLPVTQLCPPKQIMRDDQQHRALSDCPWSRLRTFACTLTASRSNLERQLKCLKCRQ